MTRALNESSGEHAQSEAQSAPQTSAREAKPALAIVPPPLRSASTPRGRLLSMLSYKRPNRSETEAEFIQRFIDEPFAPHEDAYGNRMLQIGDAPRIMWSAHTDTVHHKSGRQGVQVSPEGVISLVHAKSKKKRSNCLGADDAAGVWMLGEMIRAGIEGLYVWHRAEEVGGLGSSYIASKTPEVLEGIEFAIAFDRCGKDSVITHQGFERCLSERAAKQIAALLNAQDDAFGYAPDDTGLFTDTKNYVDLIGECTNISVGYEREHGPCETQDLVHLLALRDAVLKADWASLVAHRKPGEKDPDDDKFFSGWDTYGSAYGSARYTPGRNVDGAYGALSREPGIGALIEFIRERPVALATFLRELGYDLSDIAAWADDDIAPWHRGES